MLRKLSIVLFISVLLAGGFLSFPHARAQLDIESGDISFDINPEVPKPNETVTINIGSYVVSLDTFYIEWYQNDVLQLAGFGEKQFNFTSGQVGETVVIEVRIKEDEKSEPLFVKRVVSKPGAIDALWQAIDSYTPPFYKGKALPSSEGIIKVSVIPSFRVGIKNVSPKNVIYEWKKNFELIPEKSGYGKNTLSFKQSYLNSEEKISVTATEVTENGTAKANLSFKPYNPKIVFYEKDPLLGITFNKGISESTELTKNDKTIIAAPYFVNPEDQNNDDLVYTWSLNGSELSTPEIKNQIVLRGTNEPGTAILKLAIESVSKLFLSVTKQIELNLR